MEVQRIMSANPNTPRKAEVSSNYYFFLATKYGKKFAAAAPHTETQRYRERHTQTLLWIFS